MSRDALDVLVHEERQAAQARDETIFVCMGTACLSVGGEAVKTALDGAVEAHGMQGRCAISNGGCRGMCARGPLVTLERADMLYERVQPQDAEEIVTHLGDAPVQRLVCPTDTPFFRAQKRIVLEYEGKLDPERIESYITAGGYTALATALAEMTPARLIDQITRSGLRGRGGAGYSTGLKWSTVAKAPQVPKYVICNGDEGDPGAFMDRSVMEDYPFKVLEGMTLAAYAVGATQGYAYIRAEYPLAVKRMRAAIRQAQKHNLLGANILGSAFSFEVDVRLGAGAFVCGEETALIASIEGKRGTPRPRPPYPAEHGLWGQPTLINNVETYANIPPILEHGADWFANIGTEKSKGTKVFSLTGRINRTGLIEVPMGMTLRQIIDDIGGGIPDGKRCKAVQTGGPSGGCIPASLLDMPVDYEALLKAGSFMGSGGMIVMDETSCMVDVTRYFMEFCMSESCGKCVPCRVGTAHMHDLLEKITTGEATLDDLAQLERLAEMVKATSLCGLGQGAPNPILSTLRYFRDEYLAHIVDKVCPAGVCPIHHAEAIR
jgi:bidirectional [NiFe] hydrogenase diaphorase subunit